MSDWEAVVGLEIHVHLKTRTKMFCRCETGFGAPENTHTCPVCLAHPGALPVANRTAVEWTIKLGLALGSEIAERAVFEELCQIVDEAIELYLAQGRALPPPTSGYGHARGQGARQV